MSVLLSAQGLTKAFGIRPLFSDLSFDIREGERIGLIGPNGAGKSTFFNCLAGDLTPSAGRVLFDEVEVTRASAEAHARLGIGRTFQVPATFEEMSILDNVMVGAFLRHPRRGAIYSHLFAGPFIRRSRSHVPDEAYRKRSIRHST